MRGKRKWKKKKTEKRKRKQENEKEKSYDWYHTEIHRGTRKRQDAIGRIKMWCASWVDSGYIYQKNCLS